MAPGWDCPLPLHNSTQRHNWTELHSDSKTTPFSKLPYAGVFCLITSNMKTHQNLINAIHKCINSMGMKLKPSKCRSLSIKGGYSVNIPFTLVTLPLHPSVSRNRSFLENFSSRANRGRQSNLWEIHSKKPWKTLKHLSSDQNTSSGSWRTICIHQSDSSSQYTHSLKHILI